MIAVTAQAAQPQRFTRELVARLRLLGAIVLLVLLLAWLASPSAASLLSPLLVIFKGFSITVALLAFAAGWSFNARRGDSGMFFLACVLLVVAFFELTHFLSQPAELRFSAEGLADDADWIKTAARISLALSLLLLSLHSYWQPVGEHMRYWLPLSALGFAALVFIVIQDTQPAVGHAPELRLAVAGTCIAAAWLFHKAGTLNSLSSAAVILGASELIPLLSARPADLPSVVLHSVWNLSGCWRE